MTVVAPLPLPRIGCPADHQNFGNYCCERSESEFPNVEIAYNVSSILRLSDPNDKLILFAGSAELPADRRSILQLYISEESRKD